MMIRKGLAVAAVLVTALLTGCSSMRYSEEVKTPIVEAAKPAADQASIIFYRPVLAGGAIAAPVAGTVDGSQYHLVAVVNTYQSVIEKTTPGKHVYIVGGEGQNVVKADVAAGKIYFVRVEPFMGLMKARFELQAQQGLNEEVAYDIKRTTLVKPNDLAIKEMAPQMSEKVREGLAGKVNRTTHELKPEDGVTFEQFEAMMK